MRCYATIATNKCISRVNIWGNKPNFLRHRPVPSLGFLCHHEAMNTPNTIYAIAVNRIIGVAFWFQSIAVVQHTHIHPFSLCSD